MTDKIKELEGQVLALREFIRNAPVSTGTCMCGSPMGNHGYDNHSACDQWGHMVDVMLNDTAQAGREAESRIRNKAEIEFVDFCFKKLGMGREKMELAFLHYKRNEEATRLRNGGSDGE